MKLAYFFTFYFIYLCLCSFFGISLLRYISKTILGGGEVGWRHVPSAVPLPGSAYTPAGVHFWHVYLAVAVSYY